MILRLLTKQSIFKGIKLYHYSNHYVCPSMSVPVSIFSQENGVFQNMLPISPCRLTPEASADPFLGMPKIT